MHANFTLIEETSELVLIRDEGPWDRHLTVTNDAEWVVEQLADTLQGRRLEYIDSMGYRDQILVSEAGEFSGFAPTQLRKEHWA